MRPTADLSPASLAATAAVAALSVACGSLDGHTGTPSTLATLHGEMTNSTNVSLTAAVRVAVVWLSAGPTYNVAEDLPVQPVFPSKFVIQLDDPPPQGTLTSHSSQGSPAVNFQIAQGFVVAYEDLNGNGKLDLVRDSAGAFVDKIVGASPQGMSLVYFQGALPPKLVDSSGKSPLLGYNLFLQVPCAGDGGDAGGVRPCFEQRWFDVSSPYDLDVSNDAEVNQLMCADFGHGGSPSSVSGAGTGWSVDTQGTPPGGYPAFGASGLTCNGTTSYTYSQCQVVHNGLCDETATTNCTELIVDLGSAPVPAGWPCACTASFSGASHGGTGWSVDTQGTPPDGYPAPGASGLTCHGTTSYIYSQCLGVPVDGQCNCTDLSVALGSAPAPAGWPCP